MSGYQRVPTAEIEDEAEPARVSRAAPLSASTRAEFDRAAPAWWKRALVLAAIVLFGWGAVKLGGLGRKPQVIYASRYSDEFKYRPAASPVITEYLKDGRMRIRGASVGSLGVREEDKPKTEGQKRHEEKLRKEAEKKRRAEAREAAKERLGIKGKKAKATKTRGKSEV
ncbi:hypothetical protein Q5752_006959 [Cryptotrichosporon argae]